MLFWLFIIIGIIGMGLLMIGRMNWDSEKHRFLWWHDTFFENAGLVGIVVGCAALIISLMFLSSNYIGIDAIVAEKNERYSALTYKIESGACRDDFGLLNKEVIDEIQAWNEDIKFYQNIQRDFWIGIYVPNIYDQFKTIDYTSFNTK